MTPARRKVEQRRTGRGDEGTTLMESLITVAVIGIAFTAILGALGMMIRSTRIQRDQVDVNAALTSAVENIKSSPVAPCDASADDTYEADAQASAVLPNGWDADLIAVTSVTCTPGRYLQDVNVTMTSPDGELTDSARLTKYQPSNSPIHTEPPPPGPVGVCTVSLSRVSASSWLFDRYVSVTVSLAPNQPACGSGADKLKVRVVGNPVPVTALRRIKFSFWGFTVDYSYNFFVPAGTQCLDNVCQLDIFAPDGTTLLATKNIST